VYPLAHASAKTPSELRPQVLIAPQLIEVLTLAKKNCFWHPGQIRNLMG
jgi:hypothetical protein